MPRGFRAFFPARIRFPMPGPKTRGDRCSPGLLRLSRAVSRTPQNRLPGSCLPALLSPGLRGDRTAGAPRP
jgi:hypothetical protein